MPVNRLLNADKYLIVNQELFVAVFTKKKAPVSAGARMMTMIAETRCSPRPSNTALSAALEKLHLLGNHLHFLVLEPLVLSVTRVQASLDIHLTPLLQVLVTGFAESPPGDDVVPFGLASGDAGGSWRLPSVKLGLFNSLVSMPL